MAQWHPLFAKLLRPLVEGYYDVQTNLPVGDAPREADIVLVRRTDSGTPPFRGLWRNLTTWNAMEYKGPTVSPRVRDLDLLVEVGLGIDRRLNEKRARQHQQLVPPEEVSFWYLANHLGRRFLRDARQRLGELIPQGNGIWRCSLLQRVVFLVSGVDLPVDQDSLPLHVVGTESPEAELAMARIVLAQPNLWELYGPWLALLHPSAWGDASHGENLAKRSAR